MLTQRVNPKTKRKEYALVSVKSPGKVLPSDAEIARVEARVEHYAQKGPKS